MILYESDSASGGVRPVEEYQRLFPHVAEVVAEEYARLSSDLPTSVVIASDEPKQRIAHYVLERELGSGGQGRVYVAVDTRMRRRVALKVLNGITLAPDRLQRFRREVEVIARLDHPGIAPVHEMGLDGDGRIYFTMKLVKGRDLKHVFGLVFEGKEGWNETRALSVMLKVCEAMAYAHAKGVIHRDLKPANVMVGSFGEVYVMDWGLARVLGRKDARDIRLRPEFESSFISARTEQREDGEESPDSPLVTMDGDVVGTPAYMSPEQARGEVEKLSARSDVYAIGAMLYHLLARTVPFVPPGARMSNRVVLLRLLEGPPKSLHEINRRVPAELVAICEKAMARVPERRFSDTLALAEDLRAYLEHRVVSAYEAGAWAETKKWVQRNQMLAATLAAAFLALVTGLVWSLSLQRAADASAKLAEERLIESDHNADLAESRRVQAEANAELAEARRLEADHNAALAEARRAQAEENETRALMSEAEAKITELETEADQLWPADPSKLKAYDDWLERARLLVDGRPADPAQGVERKFGLSDYKEKLLEIRSRAIPLTEEQREADRRASPVYEMWKHVSARRTWVARMLGQERWPSESEVEADLAEKQLPSGADGLNQLAWSLVDPRLHVLRGDEVKGLVLARRALAAAGEAQYPKIRKTLAWALYGTGKLDLALAEGRRAIEEASGTPDEDRLASSVRQLEKFVEAWGREADQEERSRGVSLFEARVETMAPEVNARRTFEFEDGGDRGWNAELSKLISSIEEFGDPTSGLFSKGASPAHSWGIVKRREFGATIAERSLTGVDAKRRWEEAILAISKSDEYLGTEWPGGKRLTPQIGLLPIGADPESGLWEFSHLASGENWETAERGPDGKLVLKDSMGIVLVLIPGGTFTMGAQSLDAKAKNYDPQAGSDESPTHEVTLPPFFFSKYEMTQTQCLRLAGRDPSHFDHGTEIQSPWAPPIQKKSPQCPVENVHWLDCRRLLERHELLLPTEAQWEYGARGRTSTVYWSGDDAEMLRDVANIADAFLKASPRPASDIAFEEWNDGNSIPARIGSYRANPYGLHDVLGNVEEWCRDEYGPYAGPHSRGDGEQHDPTFPYPVSRGGSYTSIASEVRVANRDYAPPDRQDPKRGLRPVRVVTP